MKNDLAIHYREFTTYGVIFAVRIFSGISLAYFDHPLQSRTRLSCGSEAVAGLICSIFSGDAGLSISAATTYAWTFYCVSDVSDRAARGFLNIVSATISSFLGTCSAFALNVIRRIRRR